MPLVPLQIYKVTIFLFLKAKLTKTYDAGHKKTELKIVVIPKEGFACWDPANPSLGMTLTIKYHSNAFIDYIL